MIPTSSSRATSGRGLTGAEENRAGNAVVAIQVWRVVALVRAGELALLRGWRILCVVSGREWDLLGRLARGGAAGLSGASRELAMAIGAERLYCVLEPGSDIGGRQVHAFDYEGYPVAGAETRLPSDLAQVVRSALERDGGLQVARRPALDVRGAAVAAGLQLASGAHLLLLLEHRFGGAALSALDDAELGRWVTVCALSFQLQQAQAATAATVATKPQERVATSSAVRPVASVVASVEETPAPISTRVRTAGHERVSQVSPTQLPSAPNLPSDVNVAAPAPISMTHALHALDAEEDLSERDVAVGDRGPNERRDSLFALEGAGWNISRAARHLGITRHGLKKRMRRLGIRRPREYGDDDPE